MKKEIAVFDVVSLRSGISRSFSSARETIIYVRTSSRHRFRRTERKTNNSVVYFNDDFVIVIKGSMRS